MKDAQTQAEAFMAAQITPDIRPPLVAKCDDGEVCLLWMGPKLHVDIGFLGDGKYSYFGRIRDWRYSGDEMDLEEPCPMIADMRAFFDLQPAHD